MAENGAGGGAVATSEGSTAVATTLRRGAHAESGEFLSTIWYAPDVKYWVKLVKDDYSGENVRLALQTDVLTSFKPVS
jgi:hypothetical protein